MTAGFWLEPDATCRGVWPCQSQAPGSAPAFRSAPKTARFSLFRAGKWRGVRPFSSRALGSAPASRSMVITAGFLFDMAATCRGVWPFSSRTLGLAPASRSTATIAGFSVESAATCRGVRPLWSRALRSAPAWRQWLTFCAVVHWKKALEFQSAQSAAQVGAAKMARERWIPPTLRTKALACGVADSFPSASTIGFRSALTSATRTFVGSGAHWAIELRPGACPWAAGQEPGGPTPALSAGLSA